MAFNNAQLRPVIVFKNQSFRNSIVYSRYLRCFHDRPIYPSFTISLSAISKYDMDIPSLIARLGWESFTEDQCFLHCPEAVRLFYVNIRRDHGTAPRSFTTMVYDHEITVTPDLLASVLSFPHSGIKASYDSDFADQGFDFCVALDRLTCDIGKSFSNQLSAGRLKLVSGSGGDVVPCCSTFSPTDPSSDSLITALTQAAVSAIDSEVKRKKETGNGKTTGLLVCKERLELMEFDEARPAPDDFDPISSDSSSEDEISDYESPPSHPF
ncbi:unnamed protein product [Linum trigynum]|uniref:Uncharacterized protein n=1 Tax=Linum trigynum TaxID=586398 RepID=A0AAV2DCJ2_9ROSI